ncbi:MAG: monovalent cation/H(+) antiporter subunit G [Eubacteriales bacterium]|jgi:multicomponent Na+:H+ antiporter subunit G|nr:monovalent cation/H(+) antiporter subunit G [Bacillota bacterium]MBV1727696.1 monovalent cation/H(+) antiporter subunit G [Desulforudis sp.]MDP3051636.1 monovalent cation/H(+) antiporter subunit G [Eubacteriales bacterium]MDQ7788521.1 monovalent cation/H(+) antiporter subunit G [Clostridia bacterium]MBU4532758.1 monovalent cation/H(+) antiporter subunit G [Bacillota bacterium]
MEIKTIITAILLAVGCFFMVVAAIGVVRFPDFFARLHPCGKGDTLGQALVILGLMVYEGFTLVSVKLLIIMLFIFLANPTSAHFIAKAGYVAGVKSVDEELEEECAHASSLACGSSTDKKVSGVDSAS